MWCSVLRVFRPFSWRAAMNDRRMAREPNIPLFLWIAAAILTHLTWGGGADQVAEVFQERADLRRFATSVQNTLRQRFAVEVSLLDDSTLAENEPRPDEPRAVVGQPDEEKSATPEKPEPVKEEQAKPEKDPKQVPDSAHKTPLTKEEAKVAERDKPKPTPEAKDEKKTPAELAQPAPEIQRRVAVVQQVEDPNQAENPEAEFLGDHNNKVREQTQSQVTATDQDNAKPTPGSQHVGPTDAPGDSHVTDVAQSDDAPGEVNRAPSAGHPGGRRARAVRPGKDRPRREGSNGADGQQRSRGDAVHGHLARWYLEHRRRAGGTPQPCNSSSAPPSPGSVQRQP
jgi:hypothetical protein